MSDPCVTVLSYVVRDLFSIKAAALLVDFFFEDAYEDVVEGFFSNFSQIYIVRTLITSMTKKIAKEIEMIIIPRTQPIPAIFWFSPNAPYTDNRRAMTCVPKTIMLKNSEGKLFHQNVFVRVEKMTK